MKKILMITIMLLFSISSAEFSDMPPDHWAYSAVSKMERNGILSGYPDSTFKPSRNITLGEFASIFTKFFDIPKSNNNYFTDVGNSHWAKESVEAIREYIEPNYNPVYEYMGQDTYFSEAGIDANMPVTREIVIFALYQVFGYDQSIYFDGEEKTLFADYQDILYPKEICIAYKKGVIKGEIVNGKTYIRPDRYITRAELSAMFNNLLGFNEKLTNKEGFDTFTEYLDKLISSLAKYDFNELKSYVYDPASVLENIDFNLVAEEKIETVADLWCKNFSYEVSTHGFYSYNRAYLELHISKIDMEDVLGSLDFKNSLLDSEKLIKNIEELEFNKNTKFKKINETITIDFVKYDNEWKISL